MPSAENAFGSWLCLDPLGGLKNSPRPPSRNTGRGGQGREGRNWRKGIDNMGWERERQEEGK